MVLFDFSRGEKSRKINTLLYVALTFEDLLANTVSKKIRYKIYKSEGWVEKMNRLMGSMNTSSGLKLSLVWKKGRGGGAA